MKTCIKMDRPESPGSGGKPATSRDLYWEGHGEVLEGNPLNTLTRMGRDGLAEGCPPSAFIGVGGENLL